MPTAGTVAPAAAEPPDGAVPDGEGSAEGSDDGSDDGEVLADAEADADADADGLADADADVSAADRADDGLRGAALDATALPASVPPPHPDSASPATTTTAPALHRV